MSIDEFDDVRADEQRKPDKKKRRADADEVGAFIVSTSAVVIRVIPVQPGRRKAWVTFDISKHAHPSVKVELDGLVAIPPDAIHESSSLKGDHENEQRGSLIVHRHFAARQGWI